MADPRERQYLATPFAHPSTRIIASPFQFATTDDDNLRIESANSLAGVVIAIQGRRLTPKGEIEAFAFVHTPNTDRSVRTQDYKLGAGALLNLTIFAQSGAPRIGQTFVSARFIRGLTGATIVLGTLLAGYVTAAQHLAYPGSPVDSSIAGGGVIRAISGTDPAAGADAVETVPTGARWQVLSIGAILVTDATVATRRVFAQFTAAGNTVSRSPHAQTQGNSSTIFYTWAPGLPHTTALTSGAPVAGLPTECLLLAGDALRLTGENIQVGDNWSAPTMNVREWLEVAS